MNEVLNSHHTITFLSSKGLACTTYGFFFCLYEIVMGIRQSINIKAAFLRPQNVPWRPGIANHISRLKFFSEYFARVWVVLFQL